MKRALLSLSLISTTILGACGHYSEKLSAMDSEFGTPTNYAQNEAALNQVTPAAGGGETAIPYNHALAQAYYARAIQENERMDYSAAQYFTAKASVALKGQTPTPGQPSDFGIARADSKELSEARAKLIAALQADKTPENQTALIAAQIEYDGWLDQQAENKIGAALTCRDGFMQALSQVESPYVENRRYGIFFAPGQTALSDGSDKIIGDVATLVRENGGKPYQIVVAEKVPGAQTQQRIQSIQDALVAQGVQPQSIIKSSAPASVTGGVQPVAYNPAQDQAVEIIIKFLPEGAAAAPAHVQDPTPQAQPSKAPFLKSSARTY
jgi:hypothetical protein